MCGGCMAKEVIVKAGSVKKTRILSRVIKLSLLSFLLLLTTLYIVLGMVYDLGNFTVLLDSDKTIEAGIAVYDNLDEAVGKRRLEATPVQFMDNISYKWLPDNIDKEADGSHNGNYYIAYSFYVENQGSEELHYWYEVIVKDVLKNVDDAIRIRIYRNGEPVTYAKPTKSGNAEPGTEPFKNVEGDGRLKNTTVILEQRKNFKPGDLDRYTIVVWLEGDDPECVDDIIGGGIKMHMKITEEHIG